MFIVHYTVHDRKDLTEDKVVISEDSEALSLIKALAYEFGKLDNLNLPYYCPELGVTIEAVTASDNPRVVVTLKAPNK